MLSVLQADNGENRSYSQMTTKPHQTKTKLKKAHSYTNLNYFFSSFGKLQKPTFTHRLIHYCTHTFSIGLVSTLIWAQPAPVVLVLMIKSSRLDKWMGSNALQIQPYYRITFQGKVLVNQNGELPTQTRLVYTIEYLNHKRCLIVLL